MKMYLLFSFIRSLGIKILMLLFLSAIGERSQDCSRQSIETVLQLTMLGLLAEIQSAQYQGDF